MLPLLYAHLPPPLCLASPICPALACPLEQSKRAWRGVGGSGHVVQGRRGRQQAAHSFKARHVDSPSCPEAAARRQRSQLLSLPGWRCRRQRSRTHLCILNKYGAYENLHSLCLRFEKYMNNFPISYKKYGSTTHQIHIFSSQTFLVIFITMLYKDLLIGYHTDV